MKWGGWYAPLPGSDPGFLVQQNKNSLRDAVLATLNLNIFARHADRSAVQRGKIPAPAGHSAPHPTLEVATLMGNF
jgi:hypothetical protein